ncbi:putative MFS multidrug transporter [Paramyrothecium foliicola]|nr:putative MFS multidrug transporter [Paramyrothecium foliicola]
MKSDSKTDSITMQLSTIMDGSFRDHLPDLQSQRFTVMREQDAHSYAQSFRENGTPPWLHSLYLHWRKLLAEPFKGITTDGQIKAKLFGLEDEGVPIDDIVRATKHALSQMTPEQVQRSTYHIDSPDWRTWSNPEFLLSDKGVRLDEATEELRAAILEVLRAALSPEGYQKAISAMRINGFLGELVDSCAVMNEFSYNFVVFGAEPSTTSPWGFSFYGHHLCLNAFFYQKQMVLSPWFTGAEPNVIDTGKYNGTQILQQEEMLGLQLMQSLSPEMQSRAQTYKLMKDPAMPYGRWNHDDQRHLCGAYRDNRIVPYEGILVSELSEAHLDMVVKILEQYLLYLPDAVRSLRLAQVQSAFVDIAEDLGVTVQRASYLTSLVIIILGAAPFLWRPLSDTYGRRSIFLLSLLCSLVGNIGCAVSPSYETMALCRAITAFFICPAGSLGTAVVSESFFRKERARYMGIWTTMVTLGVPVAPFLFGFLAMRIGYRWVYWVLAITNALQFMVHLLFGPETRYIPAASRPETTSFKQQYLSFRRIDPAPLKPNSFIRPFIFLLRLDVIIPAAAYAMVFLWGSVMTTFEIPQIFPEKFGFNTQQVGLQYVGIIVGTVVGEQVGGALSDRWMWQRERKGKVPQPEYRLWLSYPGFLLTICGVVVFLVQIEHASDKWNVTPIIGASIAAAGNQIVTTVMVTYAVDCYPQDAAAVGVFIIFIRQCWGFIGPFW